MLSAVSSHSLILPCDAKYEAIFWLCLPWFLNTTTLTCNHGGTSIFVIYLNYCNICIASCNGYLDNLVSKVSSMLTVFFYVADAGFVRRFYSILCKSSCDESESWQRLAVLEDFSQVCPVCSPFIHANLWCWFYQLIICSILNQQCVTSWHDCCMRCPQPRRSSERVSSLSPGPEHQLLSRSSSSKEAAN